ncbi:MAG: glycosyltransferase family 39 protein [Candidatus Eisenbacteria bacterium]|nr:glycosyltransferase family 39 protein [Candidatus Eisenbacteria bacterium]
MKIFECLHNGRGKGYLLLLAVLLIGLLRLAYFYNYSHQLPYLQSPIVDAQVYDEWAQTLANGDWAGNKAFYRAPLYPYVLGIIYFFSGPEKGRVVAVLLQLALGILSVILLYRTGCRLLDRRAASAAALLFAFCGPIVFYETKLLPTSTGIFLQILTLSIFVRAWSSHRKGDLFSAGLAAGVYALVRPNALLFAGLLFLIGMWREVCRNDRGSVLRWLWMPVGCLLILSPVTIHNYIASKDLVLISSNGGMTFYQGNNEESQSGLMTVPQRLHSFANAQQQEALEEYVTQHEVGRSLKPSERSRYWLQQGLRFWRENPLRALRLVSLKGIKALGLYEYPNNYSFQIERKFVWTLKGYPVPFGFILFLGTLGWLWLPRRHPAAKILPAAVAVGLLTNLIFFVTSRYRLEMIPALALLAGWGCVESVRRIRNGRIGWREGLAVAVLAGLFLLPPGAGRRSQESIMWLHLGVMHYEAGRLSEAEPALRRALELQPENVQARSQLTMVLTAAGLFGEAEQILSPALAAGAPHPTALWAAGELRAAIGDTLGATAALREATRRAPRLEPVHLALARLQTRSGQIDDAVSQLKAALKAGAATREIGLQLGDLLLQSGRTAEAESLLVSLREEHPHDAEIHRLLLKALLTTGLKEKVRSYWSYPALPADWPRARADRLLEILLMMDDPPQRMDDLSAEEWSLFQEILPRRAGSEGGAERRLP